MVLRRPLSMQVHSVSPSSAERPAPVSHDTLAGGFRFHRNISFFLHRVWLVIWVKVILLPRSLSPSLPSLYSPPRLAKNTPPSDKVTVSTLSHTLPTEDFIPHTLLWSNYFLLFLKLWRNSYLAFAIFHCFVHDIVHKSYSLKFFSHLSTISFCVVKFDTLLFLSAEKFLNII